MKSIVGWANRAQDLLQSLRAADFLAPVAIRLYLAPIFLTVGLHKAMHFADIVSWFEYSLELPMPWLMAFLATSAEIVGGLALLLGLATRWFAIPLMITMLVAAMTAHWENGWFAVTPTDADTSIAGLFAPLGFSAASASLENSMAAAQRLERARDILREHGHYEWLTETGSFVILNNGIEFAATYFILLLSLFFFGPGRYLSLDYWIAKRFRQAG